MTIIFNNNEYVFAEQIEENGKKAFTVKIPFALKDDFKKSFPSAKWDSIEKVWIVGPRSGKKLAQWVDFVAPKSLELAEKKKEEIQLIEEIDLTEQEKTSLNEKLAYLKSKIQNTQILKASLEKNRIIIDNLKEQIKELNLEKEEALIAEQSELNKNEILMNQLFNIDDLKDILESIRSLLRYGMNINKTSKRELGNLQLKLQEEYLSKLSELGLSNKFIYSHYSANVNRPDRDLAWINEQPITALFSIEIKE